MTVKKTLIIGGISIFAMASVSYVIYRLRLAKIYADQRTVDEAISDMQNPNNLFINVNNNSILSTDKNYEEDNSMYQFSDDQNSGPVSSVYVGSSEIAGNLGQGFDYIIDPNFLSNLFLWQP